MNTAEVVVPEELKVHNFEDLWRLAERQFLEFEVIEGNIKEPTREAWKKFDFSIDCPQDQALFKDICYRVIEELTEAEGAYLVREEDHFFEEIIDSFNFLISSYLMLHLGEDDFKARDLPLPKSGQKIVKNPADYCWPIVYRIGSLCNLLKNRPWSQTNYLVSLKDFKEREEEVWAFFLWFLGDLGITPEVLFDEFSRKLAVNLYRIETSY